MSDVSRCLILGATGGIGHEVARLLAGAGSRLLLAGRHSDKLAQLAQELGQPACAVEASDPATIDRAFTEAESQLGGLDAVVNCIGSVLLKPAHSTSWDEFQQVLTTNLGSAFAVVRNAGRMLRAHGGSVVLVSTAATRVGLANHEAIAAAKGGIEGLVRAAAATYASAGIRINAVAPGLVKTPMTQRLWEDPQIAQASMQMHALGRLGEPGDIARAIAFLVDPANSWITGQVLGVDGGLGSLVPRRRA
ncbi:MAG: SDR family NAD(P)-dependent oxidoreductase [Planctomycetaceae bacterium]